MFVILNQALTPLSLTDPPSLTWQRLLKYILWQDRVCHEILSPALLGNGTAGHKPLDQSLVLLAKPSLVSALELVDTLFEQSG
jgi:hypothetical protein